MLNFRDYLNNKQNEDNLKNVDKDQLENAKSVIDKYSNMNESELSSKIAETIKEQKQNNSFNKAAVISQIDSLGGLISQEQKEKMMKILNELSDS